MFELYYFYFNLWQIFSLFLLVPLRRFCLHLLYLPVKYLQTLMIPLEPSLPQAEHALFSDALVCLQLWSLNSLCLFVGFSLSMSLILESHHWTQYSRCEGTGLCLDFTLLLAFHHPSHISPPSSSVTFQHRSQTRHLPHTLSVCLWECYWLKWRRYIQLLLEKLCSSLKQNTESPISKCFCGVKIFSFQFWF